MTAAEIEILLYVGMVALGLWCIPWGAMFAAVDRGFQRRIDRMVETALAATADEHAAEIAADVWARHEAEKREAEMWRRVQRGVVERLKVEATEVER